ncbi:helix-turn-helix domain-containing protein [Aerobium aerolatum]|uniref:helix-turn-helix domain-containing protein n=1 Tax=Aerobium aerolatum TaxID=561088 RepID=UPI001FCCD315|nr:helix-turn-helix domain-containing protein [Aquamicrobium aerolatum]
MRSSVLKKEWEPDRTECCSRPIEIDIARLSRAERISVACDGVIDIASALFGVSGKELREPGRSLLSVARVRQIAMYVTHVELGLSMKDVGQGFARDRTTVLHACHQVEDLRDDIEFDTMVSRMEKVVAAAFGQPHKNAGLSNAT